jgi:hypothetical protein
MVSPPFMPRAEIPGHEWGDRLSDALFTAFLRAVTKDEHNTTKPPGKWALLLTLLEIKHLGFCREIDEMRAAVQDHV